MREQTIMIRGISRIKPYENNPRKNDAAVDAVAASIRDFGFQQPIIIDEAGIILAGHTRYRAAKKLGLKAVPVIVAEGLNDAQKIAFRIADNKTAELAKLDFSKLDEEVQKIDFSELEAAAKALDFSRLNNDVSTLDWSGIEGLSLEELGFKAHELDAMKADAEIDALLDEFDETSPQKPRLEERKEAEIEKEKAKEEGRTIDEDRIVFTAKGKREEFGDDFWNVAGELYARGIKVDIEAE